MHDLDLRVMDARTLDFPTIASTRCTCPSSSPSSRTGRGCSPRPRGSRHPGAGSSSRTGSGPRDGPARPVSAPPAGSSGTSPCASTAASRRSGPARPPGDRGLHEGRTRRFLPPRDAPQAGLPQTAVTTLMSVTPVRELRAVGQVPSDDENVDHRDCGVTIPGTHHRALLGNRHLQCGPAVVTAPAPCEDARRMGSPSSTRPKLLPPA
jgi:hypothetical protein